jgi:hypothetical protein
MEGAPIEFIPLPDRHGSSVDPDDDDYQDNNDYKGGAW